MLDMKFLEGSFDIISAEGSIFIIGYFPLPEDAWWEEYYNPLEKRIKELRKKYRADAKALLALENEQQEIDMFRKYSKWYSSVFYIMEFDCEPPLDFWL